MCATLSATAASAKESRTFYDENLMARMTEKIEKHQWAKDQVAALKNSSEWLVKMSDEELWNFVPPPEQIRAINVCIAHDCPICGGEITRKAGHYPWLMDRGKPFKLKCPLCENVFPSNDFQPWNLGGIKGKPETGEGYIDKGIGWLDEKDGRRYFFVAYYIYWQRWVEDVLGGMELLSRVYLLTGDPVYAHKCAIMMSKVASEYERFEYVNQSYHEGVTGVQGRISDYIWSTGNNSMIALTYDAIYPALAKDKELTAFLKGKDLEADPRALIEKKMLYIMVKDVMSGFVKGNMGAHQETLCNLAIVLDNDDSANGPTTKEMREWIMSGPGRVEDLLWNGFWREGLGGESSPIYSAGWCNNFYSIAQLLPKLGVDIWSNPKLKKMADVGLDLTIVGRFCPSIGDCGSIEGASPIAWYPSLQGLAFTHYGDPRHAKALKIMNASSKSLWGGKDLRRGELLDRLLFDDFFDEEAVEKIVEKEGTDLGLKTRNLGGYGLAILESGKGKNRRGVSMYYGDATGGHGHHDRLNIEMFAYDRPMLPEDGYPTPFTRPDFYEWREADTYRHYCVMIDEGPQQNLYGGDLNTLAASPAVQFMDASAETVYEGVASLYRRTTVLIDISEEDSYLIDIFRVRGGSQHDWCFHGPAFFEDFSVTGGELGPVQEKGTLAGEDVPFGAKPPQNNGSCGFQGLYNVRRMKPEGAWSATWRKADEDLALTMHMPARCAGEVIYAEGSPELSPGSPDKVQYVLGRNVLAGARAESDREILSRYIAVVEPHRGTAKTAAVKFLESEHASAETVGLVVHRGIERDLIHNSLAADKGIEWNGDELTFSVTAEFALLTLDEQGIKRAVVINGTLLKYGDFELRPSLPPKGNVLSVDHERNAITIDKALDTPEAFVGIVAVLGNELQQTSYTIESAKVEGHTTTLEFGDVLFVIGMGAVAETDSKVGTITPERPLNSGYGRNDTRKHEGRWLYNEDKSRGFRISSVQNKLLKLEGVEGDLDAIFNDPDGDGRRLYWISDIGPGDEYRIPAVTHFAR